MKKLFLIILLVNISTLLAQNSELVLYRWLGQNSALGESYTLGFIEEVYLNIPGDYKQSHDHYGEGVITALQYGDSMYVALHIGFCISKPFLKYYTQVDSIISDIKSVRFGINSNSYWKEINYKTLPISIFYNNVPSCYKDLFDKIVDSVVIKLAQK